MGRRSALALLGAAVGLLAAGCGSAAHPTAQPPQRHAGTTTSQAPASTSTSSTTTTGAPESTTTSLPAGPGVLANCTAPAPQSLAVEPSTIYVACADAGIGARDLVWSSWTASTATAAGDVWENDCTPNCASGTIKLYPASITLSEVQSSRNGPTFTSLTATYSGTEPNGRRTDTFMLEKPLG